MGRRLVAAGAWTPAAAQAPSDGWDVLVAPYFMGAAMIWMALGTTVRNTNVDFNQGAFAAYGLRRLGSAADLTVGMRVNTLHSRRSAPR